MVKWEYKYLQISNDRLGFVSRLTYELNVLGERGWEFTGHVITEDAWNYYFLKRVARDNVFEVEGRVQLIDGQLVPIHEPVVHVNHFDTATSNIQNRCGICNVAGNHDGVPHGEATGDMLTREDIIGYLNGRGFRNWH